MKMTTAEHMIDLSVVIVTWNSAEFIEELYT